MDRAELTTAEAFKQQFDSNSLLLRTILPGQVVEVNLSKNTVGVQFHPEKSQKSGEQFFLNILGKIK